MPYKKNKIEKLFFFQIEKRLKKKYNNIEWKIKKIKLGKKNIYFLKKQIHSPVFSELRELVMEFKT
jgi:poly-beta-hydroxyalkanoate depolymerase